MPWEYDERNRWWSTEFGGLPAAVTQMPNGWVAGFNGKPLTSFYDDDGERITDQFVFKTPEEGKEAVERLVERLGFPSEEGGY